MAAPDAPFSAAIGAFGYTGRFIAQHLLASGRRVRALAIHQRRPNPFGDRVEVAPLDFDDPAALARALAGVRVLYNTYWVRFDYGDTGFGKAVANTRALLRAAREAGVQRVVQISVSNPSLESPLPYYSGKAELEQAVFESGMSYAVVRPTLIFGVGDILINNIAWLLRRFPVFSVPGAGDYRLQPVAAEDVAELCVRLGNSNENVVCDAAGPEIFTFDQLVAHIREAVGSSARIVHLSPGLTMIAVRLLGLVVRDVVLTRDEIRGLMDNLLISHEPPLGRGSFRDWLRENGSALGRDYTSELARHFQKG